MALPSAVILDPAVTPDTPAELWASSGVKAIDHVPGRSSRRYAPRTGCSGRRDGGCRPSPANDTHVLSLIRVGVLDQYPDLQIIIGHLGERFAVYSAAL